MVIGTSCRFSSRRFAVTMTSCRPPVAVLLGAASAACAAWAAGALRMAATARDNVLLAVFILFPLPHARCYPDLGRQVSEAIFLLASSIEENPVVGCVLAVTRSRRTQERSTRPLSGRVAGNQTSTALVSATY